MEPTIVPLDAGMFAAALPELLTIYATAMDYQQAVAGARSSLWLDHSQRPGFRCVVAVMGEATAPPGADRESDNNADDDAPAAQVAGPLDAITGFAYGYRGKVGQWWFDEVARGLGGAEHPELADYFELTELHVRPSWQGAGIGEALLRALLAPVASHSVLLSTPEGENRAWRLYRRLGFRDVLRQFLFRGDGRPFAVLGRGLPLSDEPSAPTR